MRDVGSNPAIIGLPAGHDAGLVVGPDLTALSDPTSEVPGVFVGVSGSLRKGGPTPALPDHDGCTRQPERHLVTGGLSAVIQRWTDGGGTSVSFSEALLTPDEGDYGIYVQVKQNDTIDHTDQILRGLSVNGSAGTAS
jgi:hypothetical protein